MDIGNGNDKKQEEEETKLAHTQIYVEVLFEIFVR